MKVQQPLIQGSEQSYKLSHWVEPIHIRGIGRELADLTHQIDSVGEQLAGILSGQLELLVRKLLSEIATGNCKIAVLGQPKSGKTTLVNSLIGNKNLLPVDLAPCTSAVTRIHMGRPGAPKYGFQAHFFSSEEWDIILKKGKVPESSSSHESKIPRELFEQHSSELDERARARLGDDYTSLLGRGHSYDVVNLEVLQKYLAAGSEELPIGGAEIGKYADVTKYADLFLPQEPFAFPVTLIDTPGTDDPLLMRDEITRQNLQADIFILVLTAHTQLSDADLSLIRILHGLRKERLVIFVNRIDELSFVSADAESIFHYIRHQIDHEFPGYNIPIILGSANWSNMSLRSGEQIDFEALNQSLLPYAREVGVISGDNGFNINAESEIDRKFLAYVLEFSSGMPRLSNVISSQMLTSKHAENLAKVVRTLRTVSKGVMATVRQKSNSMEVSSSQNATGISSYNSEKLNQSIQDTKRLLEKVKDEINVRIQKKLKLASQQLDDILDDFVEGQTYELRQVIRTCHHIDKWYVNVAAIRNRIEKCCNDNFEILRNDFDKLQIEALKRLKQIFSETYGIDKEQIPTSPIMVGNWEMPLDALSQVVALDLKGAWWDFIKSESATTEAKCEKLGKLIRQDFSQINNDLIESADNELQKYLDELLKQFFTTATGVLEEKQNNSSNTDNSKQDIKLLSQPKNTIANQVPSLNGGNDAEYEPKDLLGKCENIENNLKQLEEICLKPYKLSESVAP